MGQPVREPKGAELRRLERGVGVLGECVFSVPIDHIHGIVLSGAPRHSKRGRALEDDPATLGVDSRQNLVAAATIAMTYSARARWLGNNASDGPLGGQELRSNPAVLMSSVTSHKKKALVPGMRTRKWCPWHPAGAVVPSDTDRADHGKHAQDFWSQSSSARSALECESEACYQGTTLAFGSRGCIGPASMYPKEPGDGRGVDSARVPLTMPRTLNDGAPPVPVATGGDGATADADAAPCERMALSPRITGRRTGASPSSADGLDVAE